MTWTADVAIIIIILTYVQEMIQFDAKFGRQYSVWKNAAAYISIGLQEKSSLRWRRCAGGGEGREKRDFCYVEEDC